MPAFRFAARRQGAMRTEGDSSGRALMGGSYSLLVSVVVFAIIVFVNIFAGALPTTKTMFDISASKLYSITSSTKAVVSGLTEDVTIYWIVQSGEEDDVIEQLLDKYDALSDHITVVKRNPDVYPTFAEQYTDETVANNSLVVESGDRSRYIAYDSIYVQETDIYSYTYSTSFDGEGAITSAIDYVVNSDQPIIYLLEGHGEADLPSQLADEIEQDNYEVQTLSLVTENAIPDDASAVVIYAPQTDIAEQELEILSDYVAEGGRLLVMAGPSEEDDLDVLYQLLETYGLQAQDGIVIDTDSTHYAFGSPYILLPDLSTESAITSPLVESDYAATMPIALGLTGWEDADGVTALMTTSDSAYSKIAGYELTTYDREDGDIDGPFALAVAIDDGEGQIVWFTSSDFVSDDYNAYSSTLTWLLVGLFPLAYLAVGVGMVLARRRLR